MAFISENRNRWVLGSSSEQVVSADAPIKLNAKFKTGADSIQPEEIVTLTNLETDLTEGFGEPIVEGSVNFNIGNKEYIERQGQLYTEIDHSTGAGIFAGTLDKSTGLMNISVWEAGQTNDFTLNSLLTDLTIQPVDQVVFRIPVAPVKSQSFTIRCELADGGGQISASADASGRILSSEMDGLIDVETGVVNISFGAKIVAAGNEGEWWFDVNAVGNDGKIFKPVHVFADSIFYNSVSVTYLPLSAEILGLNPVRLPADGRVPIYAAGDFVVILHDQNTTGTFTSSTTTDLGRGRMAKASVVDAGGNLIAVSAYSIDLDTGIVTWGDLAGISQPLTITDRIEDMAVVTDVEITGKITLSKALSHNFPVDETLVANSVIYSDLFAHTSIPFDQQTWTNEWSDELIGSDTVAQYNHSQFPIIVDNASAINEDWALIRTSAENYNVVGRHVGQIDTGSNSVDCAPVNPNTNQPYFIIPSGGWGAGWSAGNVLRFKTFSANVPLWIIQAIQGEATDPDSEFCLEIRGDINPNA